MSRQATRPVANAVTEFVYEVCRGPTKCGLILRRGTQTVQRMAARGKIDDEETAMRWAKAAAEQGRPDLTADMFMGLVPWGGVDGRLGATRAAGSAHPQRTPVPRRAAPPRPQP